MVKGSFRRQAEADLHPEKFLYPLGGRGWVDWGRGARKRTCLDVVAKLEVEILRGLETRQFISQPYCLLT